MRAALTGQDNMAATLLKPMKAGAKKPAAAEMIAKRIGEDIVLGRRRPAQCYKD